MHLRRKESCHPRNLLLSQVCMSYLSIGNKHTLFPKHETGVLCVASLAVFENHVTQRHTCLLRRIGSLLFQRLQLRLITPSVALPVMDHDSL